MLTKVNIKNFKSVRDLSFDARRVNLFIGEPNTGKSNILEALALLSPETFGSSAAEVLRYKEMSDLFYDQKVTKEITVEADNWKMLVRFDSPRFVGTLFWKSSDGSSEIPKGGFEKGPVLMKSEFPTSNYINIKFFKFKPLSDFNNSLPGTLISHFGDNLVSVISSNEKANERVKGLVRSLGYRLHFKPTDNELFLTKERDDELYSFPWTTVSETLRRIVFYMAVLETNTNSTLLLDEPEANTFPFYTTYLAERIALDETNQFFLTTHNPYILESIAKHQSKTWPSSWSRCRIIAPRSKPFPLKGFQESLTMGRMRSSTWTN